jgi:hypothetical protein
VQAKTATNIAFLNAGNKSQAGAIPYPDAISIAISQNGQYFIAGNGSSIRAWRTNDLTNPKPLILATTLGTFFALSYTGSNLLIQTSGFFS